MLITGVVLGIIITLLCLYVLYLRGAVGVLAMQNNGLRAAKADSQETLGRLAAKVQALKQPYDIHVTDDQLHKLAMLVNDRVVRLYEAKQAADIAKLD